MFEKFHQNIYVYTTEIDERLWYENYINKINDQKQIEKNYYVFVKSPSLFYQITKDAVVIIAVLLKMLSFFMAVKNKTFGTTSTINCKHF